MTARRLVVDLASTSKTWALTPEGEGQLRDGAPAGWDVHIVRAPTSSDGDGGVGPSDEVMREVRDAEIYFGFGMPRALFLQATALRWVHSASAGVGSALHPEMMSSDVLLTNSAGIYAIPIGEYIVAGIMHFLRGFDYAVEEQRRARWNKEPFVRVDSGLREMDSVRALIVGTGGIGAAAAVRLSLLGAACTGVRKHPERGSPEGFARVVGMDALDAELPRHDVVVLAAPLTGETRGLLTAARLDLLPPSAIVVNVARGALVDENALAERLAAGRIRGAVLDVFREEPLASTSSLWQLRQALVTPHVSAASPGRFWPRELALFLENWRRYLEGRTLRNLVDKHAGY